MQPGPPGPKPTGYWLFPRLDLLRDSLVDLDDSPDWRLLVNHVRAARAEADKPRAVLERRGAWLFEALGSPAAVGGQSPRTLLVGGDPLTVEVREWMKAVRPLTGIGSKATTQLRVLVCSKPAIWRDELARALGLPEGAIRARLSDPVADLTWCAPSHIWWAASSVQRHTRSQALRKHG